MELWYYQDETWSEREKVRPIGGNLVRIGTFIFIGKCVNKEADLLSLDDFKEILLTFDKLLDLYRYVES
jgi:hypothetical protein